MSPHMGSAHREDAVRYHEALTDGVCLAIDVLHHLGLDDAGEALLQHLLTAPAPADGYTPTKTVKAEDHVPL